MKRVIGVAVFSIFVLAFSAFVYFFAQQRKESLNASIPVAGRFVELSSQSLVQNTASAGNTAIKQAKINPDWDETFLSVLEINLDTDEDLEQIITIKSTTKPQSPIAIAIADFQPLTGNYIRIFKGETKAVRTNEFVVQPKPLLSQDSTEILCFGIDNNDLQCLTVFSRAENQLSKYTEIFSEAGRVILIDDSQSQFPVPLTVVSKEQTRSVFSYNAKIKKYEAGKSEVLSGTPAENIVKEPAVYLDAQSFEKHLAGTWYRTVSGRNSNEPDPILLEFSPEQKKIKMIANNSMTEWNWMSTLVSKNSIYISIENSALQEVRRLLTITTQTEDTIAVTAIAQQTVRFTQKEPWDGSFSRMSARSAPLPDGAAASSETAASPRLKDQNNFSFLYTFLPGWYRNETGDEIIFQNGSMTMTVNGRSAKGFFVLQQIDGAAILDFQEVNNAGTPQSRSSFLLSATRSKTGDIGTLSLEAVRISEKGVELLYKPPLKFLKIEKII